MKVLLSIKPEFALKIFDGTKRYEYRRVIFKRSDVRTIIVYVTDPIKKVIGEFEIDAIINEELQSLWLKTKNHAGITKEMFFQYFSDRDRGYAIKVKKIKKYKSPISLDSLLINTPPQSFMYIG